MQSLFVFNPNLQDPQNPHKYQVIRSHGFQNQPQTIAYRQSEQNSYSDSIENSHVKQMFGTSVDKLYQTRETQNQYLQGMRDQFEGKKFSKNEPAFNYQTKSGMNPSQHSMNASERYLQSESLNRSVVPQSNTHNFYGPQGLSKKLPKPDRSLFNQLASQGFQITGQTNEPSENDLITNEHHFEEQNLQKTEMTVQPPERRTSPLQNFINGAHLKVIKENMKLLVKATIACTIFTLGLLLPLELPKLILNSKIMVANMLLFSRGPFYNFTKFSFSLLMALGSTELVLLMLFPNWHRKYHQILGSIHTQRKGKGKSPKIWKVPNAAVKVPEHYELKGGQQQQQRFENQAWN